MLKNLLKIMLLSILSVQFSYAVMVNDGFEEFKRGNITEAISIFEQACTDGASAGCYNAGLIYYKGEVISQDYPKAVNYFVKACDDGHSGACYNLAYMYQNALGVRQNFPKKIKK